MRRLRLDIHASGRGIELGQQVLKVELALGECYVALGIARPLLHWTIPAQLEIVPVRVLDVDRFVRAVVGDLTQRPVHRLQATQRIGKPSAGRVAQGYVVQASYTVGLWPATSRLPRVKAEMVVVPPSGEE